jgi:hypothetical protein
MGMESARRLALRRHPALIALALAQRLASLGALMEILGIATPMYDPRPPAHEWSSRNVARERDALDDLIEAVDADADNANLRSSELATAIVAGNRTPPALLELNSLLHATGDRLHHDATGVETLEMLDRASQLAVNLAFEHSLDFELRAGRRMDLNQHLEDDLASTRSYPANAPRNHREQLNPYAEPVRWLPAEIDRARYDFTRADLSNAELTPAILNGVRWSGHATKWPTTEWRRWVKDNSVPLGRDTYEVRLQGGGFQVPTRVS